MPRMVSNVIDPNQPGGSGPIDPLDPSAGTGGSHRFRSGNRPGAPITDPSSPSHLHMPSRQGIRLNAGQRRGIDPNSPKTPRAKATPQTRAPRSSSSGQSVTKTATKKTSARGLLVGNASGTAVGANAGLTKITGDIDPVLLANLLEHTAAMSNQFGEIVGLYSFGQFYPIGHKPTAQGKHPSHAQGATPNQGAARRALLTSYDSGTRTATIAYVDQPDATTTSVPVALSVTDADMASAKTVGVISYADYDGHDAVIHYAYT
jgi:hypothetical protein